jgi:protein-tyrosine phosphatase
MTLSKISQPVLFVCTGNYYRSRIAEILFNHLAAKHALPLKGFSRGLRLNPQKNTGSISPHAMPFLSQIDISPAQIGEAAALGSDDLRLAGHIIVMDETEHRPMMREKFPEWEDKVEYWQMEDDYVIGPEIVLPKLRKKVEDLVRVLAQNAK